MSTPIPSISTDFTQYERLRTEAREGGEEALREVARRFEGLFIEMMLKTMRESVQEGGLFDSQSSQTYQQMYDRQISDSMSAGRGLGLADMLVQQLTRNEISRPAESRPAGPLPQQDTVGAREPRAIPDWLAEVMPHAQAAAAELGVPTEAVLAQAALESGWGRSEAAVGNNVFGIKADARWQGDTVTTQTLEVRDGVAVRERANFRAYESVADSFRDFVAFLRENPRYQAVLEGARDVASFAQGLQQAGYATDPDYATKIQRVAGGSLVRTALAGVTGE